MERIAVTRRYIIRSDFDIDLVVEADTWQKALWLGLELLERDERVRHLTFEWDAQGALWVFDLDRTESFVIMDAGVAQASIAA